MILGKVVGKVTATTKHPSLEGWRMLLVQPLDFDGTGFGDPQIAIDELGSGIGDEVILNTDGRYVRKIMDRNDSPVRYTIQGIRD